MTTITTRSSLSAMGIFAAGYVVLILVVTLAVRSESFWRELLGTPRSRTGFIAYSTVFAIPSLVFALLTSWRPTMNPGRAIRTGLLLAVLLVIIAAAILLFAFCQSWDWKMSI